MQGRKYNDYRRSKIVVDTRKSSEKIYNQLTGLRYSKILKVLYIKHNQLSNNEDEVATFTNKY